MSHKANIIYLGSSGFPLGQAQVEKQKMISKALVLFDADVHVISRDRSVTSKEDLVIPRIGIYEGIHFYFTSLNKAKNKLFVIRYFLRLISIFIEIYYVFKLRNRKLKNIALVSTMSLTSLIYYRLISKLTGYKLILSYEEFVLAFHLDEKTKSCNKKFDFLAHRYCDGIMPISSFLSNFQQKRFQQIKLFRMPVLTDFEKIDRIGAHSSKNKSILFCGSATYFDNIKFIIDSFHNIKTRGLQLTLILHGNNNQMNNVLKYIDEKLDNTQNIRILSNLSYEELIIQYKSAMLLLIPLTPYLKDRARFPHKIGEYVACKTPIVTTNFGEIPNFFINNETAFICNEYNSSKFAGTIEFALSKPDIYNRVVENAYILGRKHFHFASIGAELSNFLKEV